MEYNTPAVEVLYSLPRNLQGNFGSIINSRVANKNIKGDEKLKNILFIFLLFLIPACDQSTSVETPGDIFAIYLLRDSTITPSDALSESIEDLELSEKYLLSGEDFKSYKWSDHSFELTDVAKTKFEQLILLKGKTWGVPFIVTAKKERIYVGAFWWSYSSSMPPKCAIIFVIVPLPYKISLVDGAIDKRNDPRIYNALKMLNVLIE